MGRCWIRLAVPRIDLNNRDILDVGMVDQYLSP